MELKRVLLGRSFLFFLAALVALNGFFYLYQQTDHSGDLRLNSRVYHEILESQAGKSWEEGLEACRAGYDECLQSAISDPGWYQSDPRNWAGMIAYSRLAGQYEYLLSYEGYLEKIDADVVKLQSVGFFSKPDSVGYKNTVKTAADFSAMKGAELTLGHDAAVTTVFDDALADYSILLLMGLSCGLFLAERKSGLWPAIHAAPGGRRRLAGKRIGILLIVAFVGTYLIVGGKILLANWLHNGFGEWDRALQSISMFRNTPVPMTVGQFWGMYLLVKALGAFWIGLVLWAVLSAISNLGLALCALGLLVGAEFACTSIYPSSMFAALRYCNIFSYVNYAGVFTNYLNLSFFGHLITGSSFVLVLLPVLIAVFLLLNVQIAEKKKPISAENPLLRWVDKLRKAVDPVVSRGNLTGFEFKKVLIKRKGILLLVILALVLARENIPTTEYDPLRMYVQYYEQKYAGPITPDTVTALEGEMEKAVESDQFSALDRLIFQCQTAPEGAWLVPTYPYDAIWSRNLNNYHRTTALTAMLFLVLLLANIGSQERQSNMQIQLFTSPLGRWKLWRKKQLVGLSMAALVWLAVYGTELLLTAKYYGAFRCLAAPMNSLEFFFGWGWNGSIAGAMALYYGLKLVAMMAAAEICLLLSGLCNKNQTAILLCTGVLLIPAALTAIGSDAAAYLSLLMPLATVEIFANPLPFVLTTLVGITAAALSGYLQAKRYRS